MIWQVEELQVYEKTTSGMSWKIENKLVPVGLQEVAQSKLGGSERKKVRSDV